jgi:hypothetical protein
VCIYIYSWTKQSWKEVQCASPVGKVIKSYEKRMNIFYLTWQCFVLNIKEKIQLVLSANIYYCNFLSVEYLIAF